MKRRWFSTKVTASIAAVTLATLLGLAAANRHIVVLDPGAGTGTATGGTDSQDAQLQQVVLCGEPAASSVQDGALVVVSGDLWSLATTRNLARGWTAVHDGFTLRAVIAAYEAWFCAAGVEMFAGRGSTHVQQFYLRGAALASGVRVVFADVGTGVSVYIGRF